MNNAEVKHIFNEESINGAVLSAITGWMEKNPNHTSEERAAKGDEIRARILESRTKDKFLNSKASRKARRDHISAAVAEHGVMFTSATDLTEVKDTFELTEDEFQKSKAPFLLTILEELYNCLGLTKQVERTVTFCFKAEDIGYGQVGIKLAMSFQNPADDNDPLVAREYALSRFLAGHVVEVAMPDFVVKHMGINAVVRECLNTGVPAQYAAKFL